MLTDHSSKRHRVAQGSKPDERTSCSNAGVTSALRSFDG